MKRLSTFIKSNTLLILLITLFCYPKNSILAQEKGHFLQHRFDGFGEIITKKTTKQELASIKQKLERQGVQFIYSKLLYNKKAEITSIKIYLKNKRSNLSSLWNQKNIPIPTIKIGEVNGIVSVTTNLKKLKPLHFSQY